MERRELMIAAAVALVVLIGVSIDVFATEVINRPEPPPAGARFVERALFCPPSVAGSTSFAASTAAEEEEVSVGIEPARPDRVVLEAGRVFLQELPEASATEVVGYGAAVRAGAILRAVDPVEGEAGARCSDRASSRWFFAAGASTLGVDQRLVIYNPFPDEAVVRVTFLTPLGEQRKGGLADVPVAADSSTVIKVNEFIKLERTLGIRIDARRGRVVAWRVLLDDPENGAGGVQMSLGATADSDTWFFPDGSVAPGVEERIALINPNQEEATVTISLSGDGEIVQPDELVEIPVGPGTARGVTLRQVLGRRQLQVGGVSAVVQSTNGIGVVAERSIRDDEGSMVGSSAEMGAPRTSHGWLLTPATRRPSVDTVVVMNPGSEQARVSLTISFEDRDSIQPAELQNRSLEPGGRLRISIGRWTEGRTAVVRLSSSVPVVAERVSYSEAPDDVASVMGFPLE